MTVSAYRTVKWLPAVGYAPLQLQWPDKRPLDVLDYSLDLASWLADAGDTITSVTARTSTPGLRIALSGAGFSGTVCTVFLTGGIGDKIYGVDLVVVTTNGLTEDFSIAIRVDGFAPLFPTSPVLLMPGATWYAPSNNSFQIVPVWSALPTTEPLNADSFFLNGGIVAIPSNTTLLPNKPLNLLLGDLWDNGGTVMCNGNPGLPTASTTPGTLLYNGGTLSIS
jgi:hypothetical protein